MGTTVTANIAATNTNATGFASWAGDATGTFGTANNGLSAALRTMGFTKQSDTYTAQWANLVSVGATALPTNAGALNGSAFSAIGSGPSTGLARTAQASTHFNVGGNTNWVSGRAYVVGDVVTDTTTAALVFICTTNITGATAPISDSAHWSPYYMEIWKTGGSLTPIYMKIEYGGGATNTNPLFFVQFGTTWSSGSSGFLTGNVSLAEQNFVGTGTQTSAECDFAGDGNNYLILNWFRGASAGAGPNIFGFERSINGQVSSAPNYTSDYMTYIKGVSVAGNWYQQTMFLSGTPATATRINYGNTMSLNSVTNSLIVNNTTPAFPVWPLLGYCGNPMTILITQNSVDSTEGATQSCTVYGATHSYIMSKVVPYTSIGGASQTAYATASRFD